MAVASIPHTRFLENTFITPDLSTTQPNPDSLSRTRLQFAMDLIKELNLSVPSLGGTCIRFVNGCQKHMDHCFPSGVARQDIMKQLDEVRVTYHQKYRDLSLNLKNILEYLTEPRKVTETQKRKWLKDLESQDGDECDATGQKTKIAESLFKQHQKTFELAKSALSEAFHGIKALPHTKEEDRKLAFAWLDHAASPDLLSKEVNLAQHKANKDSSDYQSLLASISEVVRNSIQVATISEMSYTIMEEVTNLCKAIEEFKQIEHVDNPLECKAQTKLDGLVSSLQNQSEKAISLSDKIGKAIDRIHDLLNSVKGQIALNIARTSDNQGEITSALNQLQEKLEPQLLGLIDQFYDTWKDYALNLFIAKQLTDVRKNTSESKSQLKGLLQPEKHKKAVITKAQLKWEETSLFLDYLISKYEIGSSKEGVIPLEKIKKEVILLAPKAKVDPRYSQFYARKDAAFDEALVEKCQFIWKKTKEVQTALQEQHDKVQLMMAPKTAVANVSKEALSALEEKASATDHESDFTVVTGNNHEEPTLAVPAAPQNSGWLAYLGLT